MKQLFYFILFILTLSACSDPNVKSTQTATKDDHFHQLVMKLREAGLLQKIKTDRALDSLETISRADSINGIRKMLVLAGDMLELQFNGDSTQNPVQLYEPLVRQVSKRWPDLSFDSLSGTFLPYEAGGTDTGWALVRMRADGRLYERRHYWYYDDLIDYLFYRTYNKLLADRGDSSQRLYMVSYLCTDCYDIMNDSKIKTDLKHIGLLRLTREQAMKIKPLSNELLIDNTDEFKVFSTAQTEEAIKKLEATGIQSEIKPKQLNNLLLSIRQTSIYSIEDILNEFEDYFCIIDYATVNDYDPYSEMLTRMSKISKGMLPENLIADAEVSKTIHSVRYTVKKKVFERDYEKRDSIWSPYILDDVNKALDEMKTGYAFYTVFSEDNRAQLAFLPDNKAEKAKNAGFFKEFYKGSSPIIQQRYENTDILRK